ncbi:MAG: MFS transporter [Desulfatirhabdiaceae bacterium]
MTPETNTDNLFSIEFISLIFVMFFGFCNMSVFYSFYSYLTWLGIESEWRGLIVGLEPMTAFILRLPVSMVLHPGNALYVMRFSLFLLMVVLCCYTVTTSLASLILIRIVHGATFVSLVSAAMTSIVRFIPKEKSVQAFGLMSVASLVPYAVMPVVTEMALRHIHNEALIYAVVSVLGLPGLWLLFQMGHRFQNTVINSGRSRRTEWSILIQNILKPPVYLLLGMNLLIFFTYATIFYFMKPFLAHQGLEGDIGLYFTVSMSVMIVVRVFSGKYLDKADKLHLLCLMTGFLSVTYFMLGHVDASWKVALVALAYGMCMGIILPLLNALMFVISSESCRGFNSNLMLFMMDAGFFLSPTLSGMIIHSGSSFSLLFWICSGISVVVLGLMALFTRQTKSLFVTPGP